ncbi:MAG: ComF family protein, partial [Burkholderiales bacterium]|nr:ComF family protein [Burkholderiales bacterium]
LNKILHDFKYRCNKSHASVLGMLLYKNLPPLDNYDLIIPVPLHDDKLKSRGFNQADKLLDYTRQKCKRLPINKQIVIRCNNTDSQTHIKRGQRRQNLINAFKLINEIQGAKILLVDDVVTTGATINSLAKLLKQHGAILVDICCLMRSVS